MFRHVCLLLTMLACVGCPLAAGGDPLDWSVWRHMPVLDEGRIAPLDTYARKTVEAICGQDAPTLAAPGEPPRRFTAAELLFCWLADPERWEDVPFLIADDAALRERVLGLPLNDDAGRRLHFASPAQVEKVAEFRQRLDELQRRAEAKGKEFRPTPFEKSLRLLDNAYGRYRFLTFNPSDPDDSPRRFSARLMQTARAWRVLSTDRHAAERMTRDEELRNRMTAVGDAYGKLRARLMAGDFSRKEIETRIAALAEACNALAARLGDQGDKPLVRMGADLRGYAAELRLTLYDNGEVLRLVPALDATALEENRTPDEDASPWMSFQTLMFGADDLTRPYPQGPLADARRAFRAAAAAYANLRAPDRGAKVSAALERLATAIRTMGERTEPLRAQLPILHRDEELIEATAYPPPGSTDAEVVYNRLDPFFWAWTTSLAALVLPFLAVRRWAGTMFWAGVAVLLAGQACTAVGLGFRAYATGLVPLTGMFETVVFVAIYAALLGLWYALRPLFCFGRGVKGSRMRAVLERRPFAVAGATVSVAAMVLAYYAPSSVMHQRIGPVMPILRDNTWLAVHVVTIMASYASAAIALILGNIALGYYLFGRYTASPNVCSTNDGQGRRPPEACRVLAGFIQAALRITVLLLAAGTILGALWADKAWGRFWAWDPKEVWALISLLTYLLLLHARHLGWFGDFTMPLAAVLGFTAVLITWYGVNFLMGSGMHSYGAGAGGQWQVLGAVLAEWCFLLAGGVRLLAEAGSRNANQV